MSWQDVAYRDRQVSILWFNIQYTEAHADKWASLAAAGVGDQGGVTHLWNGST